MGYILIYAPPCSGKSTLKRLYPFFFDTDDETQIETDSWASYVTNLLTIDPSGFVHSFAFLPSRTTFYARCYRRGLVPEHTWYEDMLYATRNYQHRIFTNSFIPTVLPPSLQTLIHEILPFSKPCTKF